MKRWVGLVVFELSNMISIEMFGFTNVRRSLKSTAALSWCARSV